MVWVYISKKREHKYDPNIKHNYEVKQIMTGEEQFLLVELKKIETADLNVAYTLNIYRDANIGTGDLEISFLKL